LPRCGWTSAPVDLIGCLRPVIGEEPAAAPNGGDVLTVGKRQV
jgi:hypothetical protein